MKKKKVGSAPAQVLLTNGADGGALQFSSWAWFGVLL